MTEALHVEAMEPLERGEVAFLYRPRVEEQHPEDLDDVQRILILLSPEDAAYERLIVAGRKRLPRSKRRDRFWGYVDLVLAGYDMQAALGAQVYTTKTRGLRHLPAARQFATGTYDLATHGPHSHLRWTVEDIDTTDPVAADLTIERRADYIVTVANPDPTLWGLLEPPDLQSELFDELKLHVTLPTLFPPALRQRFRNRRYAYPSTAFRHFGLICKTGLTADTYSLADSNPANREPSWPITASEANTSPLTFILRAYRGKITRIEATMNTENGIATFHTENRYAAMYPHIRAVPQSTLHVIKRLRAAGVRVRIEPDDPRPLCFTFQRGIGDWLADTSLVLLASIPVNIVSNILYGWWHDRKRRDREFPSATIAFVVEEDGEIRYYSLEGQPLRRETAHEIASRAQRSAEGFLRAIKTPAPDPRRKYPIQRDHSGEVVAWFARLERDAAKGSLNVVDVMVTDPAAKADLENGKLAGMSVGAIAQRSVCSVCHGNYIECNHVAGEEYENGHCVVFIEESLPAEFSFVQDPINPATKLLR